MKWEDYLIEGTNILKNKLGITDQDKLSEVENIHVVSKLSYLYDQVITGNYDSKHLCDLHRYLFSDIYDFAGNYREVMIFKKYSGFLEPRLISSKLDSVMNEAQYKKVNTDSQYMMAKFLGDYYYDLIMIHPFREGNGRCIREFLREFVMYKFPGYILDFTKINKQNFYLGVVERKDYPELLTYEIYNALVKCDVKKK